MIKLALWLQLAGAVILYVNYLIPRNCIVWFYKLLKNLEQWISRNSLRITILAVVVAIFTAPFLFLLVTPVLFPSVSSENYHITYESVLGAFVAALIVAYVYLLIVIEIPKFIRKKSKWYSNMFQKQEYKEKVVINSFFAMLGVAYLILLFTSVLPLNSLTALISVPVAPITVSSLLFLLFALAIFVFRLIAKRPNRNITRVGIFLFIVGLVLELLLAYQLL